MEWIFIIAIGFICIAYPILLFVVIWMLPWYVSVTYFIWLALSLLTTAKTNGIKWYEKLSISFVCTFVFSIILISGVSPSDSYMFEDDNLDCFIAPALNLPAIYFVGNWISVKIAVKKQ